ncbi:hypothetical protein JOC36_001116 [Weissella uvarum]|uniref:SA1002 family membrane protein n=1 Tax=Weissella uvarum TaxID=1479233 RepID=UPI0019617C82|nr:hypothetical protein [Weissella uvarum]MBM7617559.1 hypothetical protein [Weissella uvarum]MCM0595559.1 hypothetical protein [Weissella uvarum]
MLIDIILIMLLYLLIGFVSGRNNDRFLFIKASFYFLILCTLGTISLAIAIGLGYGLLIKLFHTPMTVFSFGVIVTAMGGILNFYLVRALKMFKGAHDPAITQVEYYIQWMTLFVTIYQFFISSKSNMHLATSVGISSEVISVRDLNIVILPILLVSWISIAMMKIYLADHHID